jgi:hypothetical protein
MSSTIKTLLYLTLICFVISSCKKEPEIVSGCTDPLGDNYNADATVENNSCTFQKRFLGNYAGEFACKGAFASVFTTADMSITELIKKDEVNIIIQSTIGPLPVMGKLTKNEVTVDATLQNLSIKPGDIIAGAGDTPILADGKVKTVLTISADNKKLTGDINVTLITKEPTIISGFPIPAGFTLNDDCGFIGTKK